MNNPRPILPRSSTPLSLGTALIVEDDTSIRRGIVDALRFSGYTVREAADGEAGLDAALADGIDIVLLDHRRARTNRARIVPGNI